MSERMNSSSGGDKKGTGLYISFQGQTDFLLQEKVEKICHAVFFLLGQNGGDKEVADVLENTALTSVSIAAHFCVTHEGKEALLSSLLEIISLTRLCVTAGIVSEASARVLVEEVTKTMERILRANTLPSVSSQDFQVLGLGDGSEGRAPLSSSLKDLFSSHALVAPSAIQKDILRTHKKDTRPREMPSISKSLSAREDSVIAIVKEKGNVTIRDISSVIKDCSEKTLQRTLLALVEKGTLTKEGERRWSTYRLS